MKRWTQQDFERSREEDTVSAFYLHAAMCGTCQVASKMLTVVEQLVPNVPIGETDLNYEEQIAVDYEVESVPCLLIQKNGDIVKKIYAFQSVPYLLEQLRNPSA